MSCIDETGHVYGYLTVLRRAKAEEYTSVSRAAYWVCQCKCGRTSIVSGAHLREGTIKSCGCLQREQVQSLLQKNKIDETGKKYGKLTVLYENGRSKNRTIIWHCRCDCGNEIDVLGTHLRDGHTTSCGCNQIFGNGKMSLGEQTIQKILIDNKINYEREKTFKDLRSGLYRFDFYLPTLNCIIEYNGEQHYKYTSVFHKNKSDFLKAQERDRRKLAYCLANNIKAYCIPYWEMGNINTIDDIFQDKFLARSKFHNDEVWRLQKSKQ